MKILMARVSFFSFFFPSFRTNISKTIKILSKELSNFRIESILVGCFLVGFRFDSPRKMCALCPQRKKRNILIFFWFFFSFYSFFQWILPKNFLPKNIRKKQKTLKNTKFFAKKKTVLLIKTRSHQNEKQKISNKKTYKNH